jgi:hypothetical protein
MATTSKELWICYELTNGEVELVGELLGLLPKSSFFFRRNKQILFHHLPLGRSPPSADELLVYQLFACLELVERGTNSCHLFFSLRRLKSKNPPGDTPDV